MRQPTSGDRDSVVTELDFVFVSTHDASPLSDGVNPKQCTSIHSSVAS